MEEEAVIISMIFDGFKLVKELESKLPELAASRLQPEILAESLEEIARTFGTASDRVRNKSNKNVAVSAATGGVTMTAPPLMQVSAPMVVGSQMAAEKPLFKKEGFLPVQRVDGSDPTKAHSSSSSSSRYRRRKEEETQTVLVQAPLMGNMEIPPGDSYIWRKYGQKEILGSRFPRAYYRCTHQKLYNCPAKKQVQRLDDDPYTFRVTYRGSHTCHLLPAVQPAIENDKEAVDYPAVADMADVMFNSGSTSGGSNSMDVIFPSHHQHYHGHHGHGGDTWSPPGDRTNLP